jgi:hypothetical protein
MISQLASKLDELLATGAVVAIKSELEAEGARIDELFKLSILLSSRQIPLAVKIGGCEAITDLRIAKDFNAGFVIAPMIESVFALSKYKDSIKKIYTVDELKEVNFAFNLETKTAYSIFDELSAFASGELQGVVFGRTDYTQSMSLPNSEIDGEIVTAALINSSKISSRENLEFTIGGTLTLRSLEPLRKIKQIHLSRFETRKVVLDAAHLDSPNVEKTIEKALAFELAWLLAKRESAINMTLEDQSRISKLENLLIE